MWNTANLAGKKQPNGRLTAIERVGSDRHKKALWRCLCECGNYTIINTGAFNSENTTSCGCFLKEVLDGNKFNVTHGNTSRTNNGDKVSVEYRLWTGIKTRCYNDKNKSYSNYGGRGIKMCDRWKNSFKAFLEDMGRRPQKGLQIERKNNDRDYEPENCIWATPKSQARNRRSTKWINYKGRNVSLAEVAEIEGISRYKLRHYLSVKNLSLKESIQTIKRNLATY